MGVHGLWELLTPIGRRVSVETLAGKKLAIDASIWMIQFMKAMRDERGEMVRNAHILGFFRRICKLLFLRTKPVFVFDGGTPALKRRTVAARRRHREKAHAKIRKTAEKLLLNHLKSKRLEELAEEIKRSKSGVKDDAKGKQVASVGDSQGLGEGISSGKSRQGFDRAINQESLDELLAASIAAEEEGKLVANEQVPYGDLKYEEEGEESDDDEEMIFPVTSGNIDPAVLASLPPSMQLHLLDQMRERLMAENRQKYQKIKKVPAKFSELQIQSYLKTVAFRREINEVQKSAAGRGVGGLQTSRIASEANREYIFSSSFTGDKQILTSTGVEKNGMVNQETNMTAASDASKRKLFMSQLKSPSETSTELVTKEIGQDVETYLDDRGRVRVSRVRGLGIHMTRDLQRNLDLMKEYEQVFVKRDLNNIPEPQNNVSDFPKGYSQTNGTPSPSIVNEECNLRSSVSIAGEKTCEDMTTTEKSLSVSASGAAIEISFSEDENESKTMVDNFFMNLVFGNRTSKLFPDSISLEKNVNEFESECIWEDGEVGEQSLKLKDSNDKDNQTSFVESKGCEEDEVEWEEGAPLVSHSMETEKAASRGLMEEEADLQEAIRRSLEDITLKRCASVVPVEANTMKTDKNQNSSISVKKDLNIELPIETFQLQSPPADCIEEKECSCSHKAHQSIASQNERLSSSVVPRGRSDGELSLKDDKNDLVVCSSDVVLSHDTQSMEQCRNKPLQESMCKVASNLMASDPNLKKTDGHVVENYSIIDIEITGCKLDTDLSNGHNNSVAFLSTNSLGTRSGISFSSGARPSIDFSQKSSMEKTVTSIDGMQELVEDDTDPAEGLRFSGQNTMQEEDYIAVSEANLDDEISFLKQERANLGEEQRKLERNAESVNSEMFAECQELLQMFGLPYIIAPMEAEAQCAYMEMSNLVDGIVTDDSDVFLFGARNVYKNIFDDRKYVETYFMKDVENELGLSRQKLIRMALLLGSDYTEGVSGIGIVNAIEVVNTFPEEDGLLKFKEWVESPDPSILGLHGSHCGGNLNKKSSNTSGKTADGMENNAECSGFEENFLRDAGDQSSNNTISDAKKEVFMDKHRNVSKNWHFPPSFPSESVIAAYISPQIDESTEPFAWGKPDLPLLRKICWEKFSWSNQKADELLVPVLKEYNKHETQLRMEAFYSFNERFAKIRSQRIKKAIKGITGTCSSELTDIGEDNLSSNRKKGISPCMNEQSQLSNDTYRCTARERKSSKLSRRTTRSKTPPNASAELSKEGSGSNRRGQVVNARARGRRQQSNRGRGRGQGKGKCKGSEDLNEFTESSSDDERRHTSKMHKSTMTIESTRSSTRHRKQVNYAEDNAEINELSGPMKTTDSAALEHEGVIKVVAFGNDSDNVNKEKMVLRDYLYSGGGFCLDENETQDKGQPSPASPMKHSFEQDDGGNQWPQDVNSKSYLVSEGGLCMDESDPGLPASFKNLQGELNEVNYHRNGQGSYFGTTGQYDSMKQYEGSAHEGQVPEKEDSSLEQAKGNGAAQQLLSAMPSLKRKRIKGCL